MHHISQEWSMVQSSNNSMVVYSSLVRIWQQREVWFKGCLHDSKLNILASTCARSGVPPLQQVVHSSFEVRSFQDCFFCATILLNGNAIHSTLIWRLADRFSWNRMNRSQYSAVRDWKQNLVFHQFVSSPIISYRLIWARVVSCRLVSSSCSILDMTSWTWAEFHR